MAFARVCEKKIRELCDPLWIRKLKYLSSESLTKKLKSILGNCSFSTIYAIYKRGLLNVSSEWLEFARLCVSKRNLASTRKTLEISGGTLSKSFAPKFVIFTKKGEKIFFDSFSSSRWIFSCEGKFVCFGNWSVSFSLFGF